MVMPKHVAVVSHIVNAFSWFFLNESSVTLNEFWSSVAVYLMIPFLWKTTLRQLHNTALYPRNPQIQLTCTHWLIADFNKSTSDSYTKLNSIFTWFSSDCLHTRCNGYTATVRCAAPLRLTPCRCVPVMRRWWWRKIKKGFTLLELRSWRRWSTSLQCDSAYVSDKGKSTSVPNTVQHCMQLRATFTPRSTTSYVSGNKHRYTTHWLRCLSGSDGAENNCKVAAKNQPDTLLTEPLRISKDKTWTKDIPNLQRQSLASAILLFRD
jgi:hypothetical protein